MPDAGDIGAAATRQPARLAPHTAAVVVFFIILIGIACMMPAQTDTWWQLTALAGGVLLQAACPSRWEHTLPNRIDS